MIRIEEWTIGATITRMSPVLIAAMTISTETTIIVVRISVIALHQYTGVYGTQEFLDVAAARIGKIICGSKAAIIGTEDGGKFVEIRQPFS
jgi:hypothetical protein